MSGPERIWANAQEWPRGTGRIEVYASATPDPDEPSDEYIHADTVAEMIRQAVADAEAKALRRAANKAASFLVGDPLNGTPLRNPMAHEIAAAILNMIPKEAHND